jgi:hypothetical protein
VDVVSGVVRRVELDDPVDFGDVEPSGGDVCAEKGSGGGVAEFEEGGGSLLLFLLALDGNGQRRTKWGGGARGQKREGDRRMRKRGGNGKRGGSA